MEAIELQNVTYIYSSGTPFEKKALDNVSLKIEQGDIIGIIGHTGSGKSTLISLFNGLNAPNSGKVKVFGQDIWENKKEIKNIRFNVGVVFQYPEYQLFEETVYKDIAFGPKNMGLNDNEIKERVYEAIDLLKLSTDILEKNPFELSGGQKRLVAIAGIIAMRPEILVLDEPTAGLDPRGRDILFNLIKEYHEKSHNTTVIISHSMDDVAKYCEKVAVINDGKLHSFGTVKEVFSKSNELINMGLDLPQITRILSGLKENGFNVPTDIYTINEAVPLLYNMIKGGNKNA